MAAAAVSAVFAIPVAGPAEAAGIGLTPHRAVYDLKLSSTRGKRAMNAVRGRILYDFSGSACEGYALQFRQVTELDTGEGKLALSPRVPTVPSICCVPGCADRVTMLMADV